MLENSNVRQNGFQTSIGVVEIARLEAGVVTEDSIRFDGVGLKMNHSKETMEREGHRAIDIVGSKPVLDAESEKAIVLYKPGPQLPESNGSTTEETSKVQLLRVLETRKIVLQKEQGMAFARAVAAGFDMDHVAHLISFSECFGALRLMEACLKFLDLWREKHETGQWLEIEAAEAMSNRSEFSSPNASGTGLSIEAQKHNEFTTEARSHKLGMESSGKIDNDVSADKRCPIDSQVPQDHREYFQGQFQHPMYAQWPIHAPPGAPQVFPTYPMQGMTYYQNYPGNGPFFQPPYPPTEDPRFNTADRNGLQRQPMDSKDSNTESEKEVSQRREMRKKADRSGKNQSRMVVIRNINYITSKRENSPGSESQSASDLDDDEDAEDLQGATPEINHKGSVRCSESEQSHFKSSSTGNLYEEDGGNWQAFQKCLLRDDDDNKQTIDRDMFSTEKDATKVMKRKNAKGQDPIVPRGLDFGEVQEGRNTEFDKINGKMTRMWNTSGDELVISGRDFSKESRSSQVNINLTEIEGAKGRYRRGSNDDVMSYRHESQNGFVTSQNEFEYSSDNLDKNSSRNATDESFIVPRRLNSQHQIGSDNRSAIHMDVEFPSTKKEDLTTRIRSEVSYEPEDLSLAPHRRAERESIGYDPTLDYETRVHAKDNVVTCVTEESKKSSKDKSSKGVQSSLEKNKLEAALRKGRPSKLRPSNEAQARAGKLRAFKADLQKLKKEKEEEAKKRIEALKHERQKRIAARGSSNPSLSLVPFQTRSQLRTKFSPISHKGSKFSDAEPGSSSPLQRLPVKIASVGSKDSQKTIESSKLNKGGHFAGRLTRSVSSLHEMKREKDGVNSEPKAVTARIRRLSDPKTSTNNHVSLGKLRNADPIPVKKVSRGPEIKKISAIMSLDRTKAATLPELKIRTSKMSSDLVQRKPSKPSETSEDDNPVIEKTVVMLEGEITPAPLVPGYREKMDTIKVFYEVEEDKVGEKFGSTPEYAHIHAPITPYITSNTSQVSRIQLEEQFNYHEKVTADYPAESAKLSSIRVSEKAYQAPYARTSSLEYPCTTSISECTKSPPSSSRTATISKQTIKANESNYVKVESSEQYTDSLEKPQEKESSKGFRRLLKFGKKNVSCHAVEYNLESGKLSTNGSMDDDHAANNVSNEVHTLKNLISQDETPTTSTAQKGEFLLQ
ncbi:hypothetical protein GIB67_002605 [Kingdonia uniflora]|uniref:COP1-interacting protein 7 n=1 Tax=Kingdonia uniflora TaxID=39325 RepID=A0A7J7P8D9_9MAGN|nr:hypothetical protein GIB67_002605 [Kingdonia uniflora]